MGAGIQSVRERGRDRETEGERLQWVGGGKGAKGEKWRPDDLWNWSRDKGCWGGTGEGNLNDLSKAWYGQGSVKETGDLKWSRLIQEKTWWRWLHLTMGFELFFHGEQCRVNPAVLHGNRELHNDWCCWIIVFSGRKGISRVKSLTNRGLM